MSQRLARSVLGRIIYCLIISLVFVAMQPGSKAESAQADPTQQPAPLHGGAAGRPGKSGSDLLLGAIGGSAQGFGDGVAETHLCPSGLETRKASEYRNTSSTTPKSKVQVDSRRRVGLGWISVRCSQVSLQAG